MNVFKFELRSLRIMLLLWALAFVALITIYVSVYPSFSKDAAATRQLFATLPFAVHAALGMNVETLFSFLGFLGNVFTVILLASAMFGASLGLGLFSREGRARTTDFLLTKPRRRSSIFFAKCVAGIVSIVGMTLVIVFTTFMMSQVVKAGDYDLRIFFMITSVAGMIQLWFFAVGALLSQLIPKLRTVTPTALAVAFGIFLIGTIGALVDSDTIRWIAPAKYVDFSHVVQYGTYQYEYLRVGAASIILSLLGSFFIYTRKDVRSLT